MVIGAIIYGISNAGGDVAWSLWVTKFAPPDRVADYMSVHTFLTGVRGVLAPVVAFYVVTVYPLAAVAALGSALIIAGTLLLVPEIRESKRARKAPALGRGSLRVKQPQAALRAASRGVRPFGLAPLALFFSITW